MTFNTLESNNKVIKMWTKGVPVEDTAIQQLKDLTQLPFVEDIAVMPDVHAGKGATIGSVIKTKGAVIPSAVGVDIGCGMQALKLDIKKSDIKNIDDLFLELNASIPTGWKNWESIPKLSNDIWVAYLKKDFDMFTTKYPELLQSNNVNQLGTLGGGNHFIELCEDENEDVWLVVHSGSRGIGNKIGSMFINLAKQQHQDTANKDLAYFEEDSEFFVDYQNMVLWAQDYARINRRLLATFALDILNGHLIRGYVVANTRIDCHHNYVEKIDDYYLTRKGAISAKAGEFGIIPGSMGERSFIVRGKGNADSYNSASHGAGRIMSRTQARKTFTVEDHIESTKGVVCRADVDVIDETPKAYKNIDDVMKAQKDLINIEHTLKQFLCIKG